MLENLEKNIRIGRHFRRLIMSDWLVSAIEGLIIVAILVILYLIFGKLMVWFFEVVDTYFSCGGIA
jgi:hypothetical protein